MTFSPADICQMVSHGIETQEVERQLRFFETGFPYLHVEAPALVGRGVHRLDEREQAAAVACYEGWGGSRTKFVPASGAATRMCKDLYEAESLLAQEPQAPLSGQAAKFFDSLTDFAFYPQLSSDARCLLSDRRSILQTLLGEEGLSWGTLPKGLLAFHRYQDKSRTPFEEHLVEAALYAKDANGVAKVHLTISPEHRVGFETLAQHSLPIFEKRYGVRYALSFSEQKSYTDTIAVDLQNRPFRQQDGTLLFRPGGHGALLANLNDLEEDIVFIKNIDNVALEDWLPETVKWKKILAGKLLQLRAYIFNTLIELETHDSMLKVKEAAKFLETQFSITLPKAKESCYPALVRSLLDRPLRVCGVVKNSGEPGGGPFVVMDSDGITSLQILETAQLNTQTAQGAALLAASTHFNPVDLVCSYKDYKGSSYPLRLYSDPATGFISEKSKDGKPIKVLELPGLWNGAMSRWNTLFIEVPSATFNPVKTVIDLLRPAHCKNF
ncbi:MAG: DUF4301 family protein [Prevotellaceae bacterium]|jgi:hypothetical protein|nr:DUF4301 family protein [Prevotellaceae bacterium]